MSGNSIIPELKVYAKGTKAFFVDDELAWVQAVLKEKAVNEAAGTVSMQFERTTSADEVKEYRFEATFDQLAKKAKVLPPLCNPPLLEGIDDLTNLSHLNEPAVLHNLQIRYEMHNIYTYSGIVLVALNPFARVPLYSQDTLEAYAGRMRGELEPHLFAISEDAFQGMVRDKKNQTIIVSGESGAGKTMSAKYIMRYFASAHEDGSAQEGDKLAGAISRVEEQILATNPVLESFGNAKTTRNDNSSRFGKFLEIRFNERHAIEAAYIRTYLLERSRLVYQPATERNYHVFYQLLAAVPTGERAHLGLEGRTWESFAYLALGGSGTIEGVDDAAEFRDTSAALDVIGFSAAQKTQIHELLAALLHVGNIAVAGASERVGASIAEDDGAAATVVRLLGIDGALFRKWLTKRQIVTRSEKIVSNMTRAQALVVRDSVAKFVYAHLFDFIVRTINVSLTGGGVQGAPASFIGVLDIYGFEHFEHNSFEQFCINYANEKLQQNFNRHVFKLEQEEYQREQLANWTFVDFQDNQPCIDLIEGRLGVLALLDEESRLQQGSDATFAEKLYKQFAPPGRPDPETPAAFFRRPRFGADKFTIRHYAHDVTYEADGFIEKNKDTVPDEIQNVLKATSGALLAAVLAAPEPGEQQQQQQPAAPAAPKLSVRAARKPTLGAVFKHSLVGLMDTIEATESHYIRCIKPNEAKRAWQWDAPMVLAQLRACGVLETIRISCAGYPSRLPIPEFIHRYGVVMQPAPAPPPAASVDEWRALASAILRAAFSESDRYQVGLTKVFFRAGMLALIEKQRVERLNAAATSLQRLVRGSLQRARFLRQRIAARSMQALARSHLARRHLRRLRDTRAALLLQARVRGHLARHAFARQRRSVVLIQSLVRAHQARGSYQAMRRTRAATLLQTRARGFMARRARQRETFLITRMQGRVRVRMAKQQLQQRREEMRSAQHFKDVTYKLEGKLMTLTRQLDESQARVVQLTEKLRLAQDEVKQMRQAQDATIAKATGSLTQRVGDLEQAKHKADELCRELRVEVEATQRALEDARCEAGVERERGVEARTELQKKLGELEAELEASRAQLADVKAQHQQQMLVLQQQGGPMLGQQSGAATPGQQVPELASSIKRNDAASASRWRAAAAELATGYDLGPRPPATAPAMARQQQALPPIPQQHQPPPHHQPPQHQQLQQRRPHSVDQAASPTLIESSNASKRSTIGGDEGRTLAKMLSSLGSGFTNSAALAQSVIPEDSLEDEVFELRNEEEVREMLEHEDGLVAEVLNELIGDLQVPLPNLDAEYSPPDLLFPAHLIGLCVIKMFQYNLARRIDRLLMSTIARVQKKTAAFESDYTSAFWLSNVFELLSIIKTSMTEHQSSTYEYAESERAMNDGMQYLESLLSDIYFGWIKDLQKRFVKLIIPGVVESEALPGFTASDSGFFNRLMGTGPRESTVKIENVLSFFNHIWRTMEFYYVDQAIMRQIMSELLCNIGVTAFNNIIMRRNFCSWKRGMQIQYNLTRIEEWCKTHTVSDTTRNLDRLLQLVKLLQLQKSTEQDIDIMFEVCDLLNPAQIKKLLSIYAVSDYENPIIGPVMNEVTKRAGPSEKVDKILLDTNDLNDQVLYLTARKVPAIETYIPPEFRMPRIRALVDSQTDMAYDEEEEGEEEEEEDDIVDGADDQYGVPPYNHMSGDMAVVPGGYSN